MSPDSGIPRNITHFPERKSLRAQACDWIARLDRGELSSEEHAAFQHWVNQSPEHREEIRRLGGLWNNLDLLSTLAPGPQPVVPERQRPRLALALLSLVGVASILLVLLVPLFGTSGSAPDLYATQIGEQRTINLEDGSSMQLNTDSHAKVEYSGSARRIRLLKGEAFFDVAPQALRPFIVQAGTNAVRAVGTAFSVRLEPRNIEVLVTEGRVELVAEPGQESTDAVPEPATPVPVTIEAGHLARLVNGDESLQAVSADEMSRKLSWRQKMLAFSDEPLADVIREFNRYTNTDIVISDPAVGRIKIGGYFKAGETEALLKALESSFGIRVVRVDDEHIYLAATDT